MTIRTPATLATLLLLGLGAEARVSAQPIAPNRPPANAFGNFFNNNNNGMGMGAVPNAGVVNGINRAGAGGVGMNNGFGGGLGNQGFYGPYASFILNQQPAIFNNRGHWYANYYSHWYPNGLTNGTGALSNGGLGGGGRLGAVSLGLGGTSGLPSGSAVPGVFGVPNGGGAPGGAGR